VHREKKKGDKKNSSIMWAGKGGNKTILLLNEKADAGRKSVQEGKGKPKEKNWWRFFKKKNKGGKAADRLSFPGITKRGEESNRSQPRRS